MINKVFIGNLNFQTTEAELSQLFNAYGQISELKIVKDLESGRSRGFGFITYASQAEAESAIANLNGKDIEGRAIKVNLAESKPKTGGSGFKKHSKPRNRNFD